VSCSRHKVQLAGSLRDVRVHDGRETLISEARVKKLLAEKYQSGIEAGQKALSEQLVQQRAELLQIQSGVLKALYNTLPSVVQDCEKALVALALETAERVVGAIPISLEAVENAIRDALKELKGTAEYSVRLHPEDLELLKRNQSDLLPIGSKNIEFCADTSISRGGCLVQTCFGTIDALRETKFHRVKEAALC
jgi:flagellar assembly protein FliH